MEKYFSTAPKRNLTIGTEMEFYLWDEYEEKLLRDESILNKILDNLPKVITRDYYVYQIEVRTMPHSNPEDLLNELKKNMRLSDKVCREHEVKIIPLSWLGGGEMFNGLHFHFRNSDRNNFEQTLFNTYPFVLTLTDAFKFSPYSRNKLSYRFCKSPHVTMPKLNEMVKSQRYSDVCLNPHKENTRHRLKNVNTMEMRTFDIPFNFEYMTNLTKLLFNTVLFINNRSKIGNGMTYVDMEVALNKTRKSIMEDQIGYNYLFDMYNIEIYKWLCKRFEIPTLKIPFHLENSSNLKDYVNTLDIGKYIGGD